MNETIGIITYDTNHLKTEQVLHNLATRHLNLQIFALPFQQRKPRSPLINHRPAQSLGADARSVARTLNIPIKQCQSDHDIDSGCEIYVVLGAGLLSDECVSGKKILNCHPGIIPSSRGLDSFKWALYENRPLGNTLHFIDEKVDAGEVITVIETPIYSSDSLESLARRHYEIEIGMLSNFDWHLSNPQNPFEGIASGEPHMRIPKAFEKEIIERFPQMLPSNNH